MSPKRTLLFDRHLALGGKIVDFAGWEMPIQYPTGIVEEHLRTRGGAGLFDVSHMGRFRVKGARSAAFLDGQLTNDVRSLAVGRAQYTLIPTESGGALDDAFLYHVEAEEYLLVVNASNRERDWERLLHQGEGLRDLALDDLSAELAMISLQGPRSPELLAAAMGSPLPEEVRTSKRNTVWRVNLAGKPVVAARTGYAGEPLGFELMVPARLALTVWDLLVAAGAAPVGLGARDTLRLEAGLPLYGHELGADEDGREIPAFACLQARGGVSLAPHKASLPGRDAFARQAASWERIRTGGGGGHEALPRLVRQMTLLEPGVARGGARVLDDRGEREIGRVTSGTVAPFWIFEGEGDASRTTDRSARRAVLLGLLDCSVPTGGKVRVDVRGKLLTAVVVSRLIESRFPPYARPVA